MTYPDRNRRDGREDPSVVIGEGAASLNNDVRVLPGASDVEVEVLLEGELRAYDAKLSLFFFFSGFSEREGMWWT